MRKDAGENDFPAIDTAMSLGVLDEITFQRKILRIPLKVHFPILIIANKKIIVKSFLILARLQIADI